ncbi:MAG: type III-B CRISPR module-associated protein Cmr5 [Elusimicrobiales bacterium]|nr:type III-B CRISPR module-associated protein Cmr5 [Elusimicrobiales bacterium]HOJ85623.1 type III-B CRISPR module-associated protein Cmr5 [Elusimicrobiales bacterium]HOL62309.1 type III-B CRISPR module-associated protein Cmr5 [Elusimicrobiales bacterium]HPO94972.1 type III-B CRISPR module-associated protein Cmr5 [Elusimicrobiales bacterium]
MSQTIDQQCAKSAYDAYNTLRNNTDKEKIFSYAKKLPMMIIHSGLPNALMFKLKDHGVFVKVLLEWLVGSNIPETEIENKINSELLSDATKLRYHTVKAMRWLEWFNRFADTEN